MRRKLDEANQVREATMIVRRSLATLLVLVLAACASAPRPILNEEPEDHQTQGGDGAISTGNETAGPPSTNGGSDSFQPPTTRPILTGATARKEVQDLLDKVRRQLDKGSETGVRDDLEYALQLEPANKDAVCLLKGVTDDPIALLGKASTHYTVRTGDTLGTIAHRVLGNACNFYLLARYAGIGNPGQLSVGSILRLPANYAPPVPPKEPMQNKPSGEATDKGKNGAIVEVMLVPNKVSPEHTKKQVELHRFNAETALRRQRLIQALSEWNALLALAPNDQNALVRRQYTLGLLCKWEELEQRVKKCS